MAKKDTHHATVQRSGNNANPRKRKKTEMMPANPALLASRADKLQLTKGVPQNIGTTRNGGRTNHVLTVAKKDTHRANVQRSGKNANPRKRKNTEMMPVDPALLASLVDKPQLTK